VRRTAHIPYHVREPRGRSGKRTRTCLGGRQGLTGGVHTQSVRALQCRGEGRGGSLTGKALLPPVRPMPKSTHAVRAHVSVILLCPWAWSGRAALGLQHMDKARPGRVHPKIHCFTGPRLARGSRSGARGGRCILFLHSTAAVTPGSAANSGATHTPFTSMLVSHDCSKKRTYAQETRWVKLNI
jgi:hypothetical protein